MSVTSTVTQENGQTVIRTTGSINSLEEHIRLIVDLYSRVVTMGLKKLLVDDTGVKYVNRMWDTFQFGEYLSKMLVGDLVFFTMGIAVNPEALEVARFFETVCTNRGLNVKVFDSLEKARIWLDKQKIDPDKED